MKLIFWLIIMENSLPIKPADYAILSMEELKLSEKSPFATIGQNPQHSDRSFALKPPQLKNWPNNQMLTALTY